MKLDWYHGIFYITVTGMEWCWLYSLLVLLNTRVNNGLQPVFGLWLLYPLAFVFNRALARWQWPGLYLYLINIPLLVIGMLVMVKVQLYSGLKLTDSTWLLALPSALTRIFDTFNPELIILFGGPVLWWLGGRLARRRAGFASTVAEFQFGLVMLVFVFWIASMLGVGSASTIPVALTFFLCALLGIAVTHAREKEGWLTGLYRIPWSGLVLLSISLVLILGLIVSSIITPELLQMIWAVVKMVLRLVMQAIAWLVSLLPESTPQPP